MITRNLKRSARYILAWRISDGRGCATVCYGPTVLANADAPNMFRAIRAALRAPEARSDIIDRLGQCNPFSDTVDSVD